MDEVNIKEELGLQANAEPSQNKGVQLIKYDNP